MPDLIGANGVSSVTQYVVCSAPIAAAGLIIIGVVASYCKRLAIALDWPRRY